MRRLVSVHGFLLTMSASEYRHDQREYPNNISMHKSKLLKLLVTLSMEELRLFRKFVSSPYFSTHQPTLQLLDYLLEVGDWQSSKLKLELVFAHLHPGEPFQEQRVRTLMSNLFLLLKRFLAQQTFDEQVSMQRLHLLLAAQQRKQTLLFKEVERKQVKGVTSNELVSDYWLSAKTHLVTDGFNITQGKRTQRTELAQASKQLDLAYLHEKLRVACQLEARQQVFGQTYEEPLLQTWLDHLSAYREVYAKETKIWPYYLTLKMLKQGRDEDYTALKTELASLTTDFQRGEGQGLYKHAINFCVARINSGDASYKQELFSLYRQMLEQGALHQDGFLLQWDYTNIVSLATDLGAHKWIKDFLFTQRPFLPEKVRQNTFYYNFAVYNYHLQQYDEAIATLQQVVFTEPYYNLLTKLLLLKIYYEQADDLALDNLLDTFRIYLLRHKELGEQRRKSGALLIRLTRRLQALRLVDAPREKAWQQKHERLREDIQSAPHLLNKAWLLRMLQQNQ